MVKKKVTNPKHKKIKKIEGHLRNYQQYKIGIKNLQLQLDSIMPKMTASYELREGSLGTFNISSPTETYAIDRIESKRALILHEEMRQYQLIIDCIDKALEGLDDEEQKFITYRYIQGLSSRATAKKMGYSDSGIFVVRNRVMDKLVHSLGGLDQL